MITRRTRAPRQGAYIYAPGGFNPWSGLTPSQPTCSWSVPAMPSAHARGVTLAFPTSSKCGGETQMGPHLCLQRLKFTYREKPLREKHNVPCPNLPIRNVRAGGGTRLPLSKHPVLDLPGRAQGIGCRCRLTPPQAHLPCGCREEIPPFS